jgi:uncharacterized protein (TIGR02172 family)
LKEVNGEVCDNRIKIQLSGHIDSVNAAEVREAMLDLCEKLPGSPVDIDAESLKYISSAGLRAILHVVKKHPDVTINNASREIYDILDLTGFTQMMKVYKAYRQISVEGCDIIGKGANGTVYRIDNDTVVKVYNDNSDSSLAEIEHEREVAKLALILGIPTAIPYDVVRVGDCYGSVFELLNAKSFSVILATEPERFDWCVDEYVELLRKIHSTEVPSGKLPDFRDTANTWADYSTSYLPENSSDKLKALVAEIPYNNHMIHGDYHTKNIQLTDDEVLLIDMDTLAVGHPVFELASMYNAFRGFSEIDHNAVLRFQGFDYETAGRFWHEALRKYLGTEDERVIKEVEDKARVLGYSRLIRRSLRRSENETPEGKALTDLWISELTGLLDSVDTLLFNIPDVDSEGGASEIETEATINNLNAVTEFIEEKLEAIQCPLKTVMAITIAAEEIFVNIAKYAYAPATGMATVKIEFIEDPLTAVLTFIDKGMPYNPLAKVDPDVTLSADERPIGGLGIYMVKKSMDDVQYEYTNGCNILRLYKKIGK